MAVINVELPLLLLAVALVLGLVVWFLGTFTHLSRIRSHRYRISLGLCGFALSGLMGFFCALKLAASLFGDFLSTHPISILVAIAYAGYGFFGFLGCWTALRVAEPLDRRHTLSVLYSLLESKKQNSGREGPSSTSERRSPGEEKH